jgi:hypothetical protein
MIFSTFNIDSTYCTAVFSVDFLVHDVRIMQAIAHSEWLRAEQG